MSCRRCCFRIVYSLTFLTPVICLMQWLTTVDAHDIDLMNENTTSQPIKFQQDIDENSRNWVSQTKPHPKTLLHPRLLIHPPLHRIHSHRKRPITLLPKPCSRNSLPSISPQRSLRHSLHLRPLSAVFRPLLQERIEVVPDHVLNRLFRPYEQLLVCFECQERRVYQCGWGDHVCCFAEGRAGCGAQYVDV